MKEIKNLTVIKTDIARIGHTVTDFNGDCAFSCECCTSRIEEILLRNILELFGEEYKIIDVFDDDEGDITFQTNLPYDEFLKYHKKFVAEQFVGDE